MLYPTFAPNFKILGSVVPEKSLTKKKKFTHTPSPPPPPPTHTNIVTEKTKTIYPLYTSYTGGIIKADVRKHYDLYVNKLVGDVKANPIVRKKTPKVFHP